MSSGPPDIDIFDLHRLQTTFDSMTEGLEEHFETVARSLYDSIQGSTWVPEAVKPPVRSWYRSSSRSIPPALPEPSWHRWLQDNASGIAFGLALLGAGTGFWWWRRRRQIDQHRKRRARRGKGGVRIEVVVVAGPPQAALTRSIVLDLERRGFIVYVPVRNREDETAAGVDLCQDIRPLRWNSDSRTITEFEGFMKTPLRSATSIPHGIPPKPHLSGLVLVPGTNNTNKSIVNISSSAWNDAFDQNLVQTFEYVRSLVPLLTDHQASILGVTSSIHPSITTENHVLESVVSGALDRYLCTLRKELTSVNVCHLKLGQINLSSFEQQLVPRRHHASPQAPATNQGDSTHRLHTALFDAMARRHQGTVFVGSGSRTYDLVGRLLPESLIARMLRRSGSSSRSRDDFVDFLNLPGWEKNH